eukprot:550040-Amphidinium_carterae.1
MGKTAGPMRCNAVKPSRKFNHSIAATTEASPRNIRASDMLPLRRYHSKVSIKTTRAENFKSVSSEILSCIHARTRARAA